MNFKEGIVYMQPKKQIRELGHRGRVVLPIEMRELLRLKSGSSLELWVDQNMIILKKQLPSCIFCGISVDLTSIRQVR